MRGGRQFATRPASSTGQELRGCRPAVVEGSPHRVGLKSQPLAVAWPTALAPPGACLLMAAACHRPLQPYPTDNAERSSYHEGAHEQDRRDVPRRPPRPVADVLGGVFLSTTPVRAPHQSPALLTRCRHHRPRPSRVGSRLFVLVGGRKSLSAGGYCRGGGGTAPPQPPGGAGLGNCSTTTH